MKTKDFYYELPQELIAQTPLEDRDKSRLLVYDRHNKAISDKYFYNIIDYLNKGDVLVVNKTKVLPARIFGTKQSGANIEFLLNKRVDLDKWEVLTKPAKRAKVGDIFKFSDELSCEILQSYEDGLKEIKFIFDGIFEDVLDKVGTMPLPHYIKEKLKNKERYQTVYAKDAGSAAAPTAGLHFTNELLDRIREKGIEIVEILLHVGLGTFRPVKAEDIKDHKMHSEYYSVSDEAAQIINLAKQENRRVIAVGTTSVRTLESVVCTDNGIAQIKAGSGDTSIFIYPGYEYKIIDGLITNFHLPESTLIMLVAALLGKEETLRIYNHAVKERYRFFSFGDACLFI